MLEFLFPTYSKVSCLEETREELEKTISKLQEELTSSRRANAYDCEQYRHNANITKRDHLDEINHLMKEQDLALDENYAKQSIQLEDEKLKFREQSRKEVEALNTKLNETLCENAAVQATVEALEDNVVSLQEQVEDYYEVIQFLSTKIPNVDLSKFNVNVDIQPTEVNVVGGKKTEVTK